MTKYPGVYKIKDLLCANDVQTLLPGRGFVPARPIGFCSFPHRFKAAWMVFTGKGDVVLWDGDQ